MPHTTNWQLKALTLLAAAVAICLTAACGDSLPDEFQYPSFKRIMPMGPCPNDINIGATRYTSYTSYPRMTLEDKKRYAEGIVRHYDSLIWNVEEVSYSGVGVMPNGYYAPECWKNPDQSPVVFIEVGFDTDDVDQSKLSPEERIPHCLDGVPVHFLTNQGHGKVGEYEEPEGWPPGFVQK